MFAVVIEFFEITGKDTYRFTFEENWKEFEQRRTMLSYRSWLKTMQSLVQSQSNGKYKPISSNIHFFLFSSEDNTVRRMQYK